MHPFNYVNNIKKKRYIKLLLEARSDSLSLKRKIIKMNILESKRKLPFSQRYVVSFLMMKLLHTYNFSNFVLQDMKLWVNMELTNIEQFWSKIRKENDNTLIVGNRIHGRFLK